MRRSNAWFAAVSLGVLATAAEAQTPPPAGEAADTVEAVVVTAAPYAVAADAMTAAVDVVDREQLDVAPAQSLGDVLANLPGLRSTSFSPGASRPVIRGLSGPRVQVLTNGVGAIDASALSPDHQVATDPAEARQIEVLRGASTLQYGGAAIGGVVNILDDRVPSATATGGVDARLSAQASSVDDGRSVSGSIKVGEGPWVFTADGVRRRSDDYAIPRGQISRRLAEALGVERDRRTTVLNSASALDQYGAGVSYVGSRGFIGASLKQTESDYGVVVEPDVTIALSQTRADVRGEADVPFGLFATTRFSAGYAEYEHTEFEGEEVGTRFLSDGWEGRLDLIQQERGDLKGSVGFQALKRSFEAIGEEAYVPSTEITELGVYTLQRLDRGPWGVEGGARVDTRRLETERGDAEFTNLSLSGGVFGRPREGLFLGVSVSRSQRAPKEEELFAEGPHVGTGAFEIGDPAIRQETAYSIEATAHYDAGRFGADLHLFHVNYDGFIDFRPNGEIRDDLPVFLYRQTDARSYGAEIEAAYTLWEDGDRNLRLEGAYDVVRAESDLGQLPRIPPWSATARLAFEAARLSGHLEVRRLGRQDRVADFELPTDGYALLSAFASIKLLDSEALTLFVAGNNLTDEEAREHASFLKDIAPLPGRNFRAGLAYRF